MSSREAVRSLVRASLIALTAFHSSVSVLHADSAPVEEDAIPAYPFQEGDTLGFQELERLQNYLPAPFWEHREFFFFEGMQLQIGAFHKDYSPTEERRVLTAQHAGEARLGRDGSLENYSLGLPFPDIDPEDPEAGYKYAWNMDYKHDALEGAASWYFTYWDRGEQLPLWYKGSGWAIRLSRRTDYADRENGNVFDHETRKGAGGIEIIAPFDARGIIGLGYRYLSSDKPMDEARRDDIWAYVPALRRVRRLSASARTDSISGTDMTADDSGGFSGITAEFFWEYLGEGEVLAAIDSTLEGYPGPEETNFGPTGFSLANDVWQLRRVVILEQRPRAERHPYSKKILWVDKQTYTVLYAAAYDRHGELWKLSYNAHRWTESEHQEIKVDRELRTFLRVVDVLVNVLTGTGVRIELFDVHATRLTRGKIRRQIDIGRLSREGK